jgi:hypothetical protein
MCQEWFAWHFNHAVRLSWNCISFTDGYCFSACRITCLPHRLTCTLPRICLLYTLLCTRRYFALFSQTCDVHHTQPLLFTMLCGHFTLPKRPGMNTHSEQNAGCDASCSISPTRPATRASNSRTPFSLILRITTIQQRKTQTITDIVHLWKAYNIKIHSSTLSAKCHGMITWLLVCECRHLAAAQHCRSCAKGQGDGYFRSMWYTSGTLPYSKLHA